MTAVVASPPSNPWRSRIVGSAEVPPSDLIANPANWRRHPSEQRDALGGALDEVGWVQHVVRNRRTGHLVDGHLRVELALARGEATVPVVDVDLSEAEERLILATLDPLAAMAEAEANQLAVLLARLEPADEALRGLLEGLARDHGLDGLLAGLDVPDDVLPLPEEPWVNVGELYALGDHRLLCGDATSPADVARLLDGAEPRLLVTDPPYGVGYDPRWRDGVYNDRLPASRGRNIDAAEPYMQRKGRRNATISGDTRADWSEAFALVPSLSVAYVWHGALHAAEVAAGLQRIGFVIRGQIIWAKTQFAMSRSDYHWQHEPCCYAVRKGKTAGWRGAHDLSTVWELASPLQIMGGSDEEREDHPTQKPAECMARPIRHHGGDVYDPFVGSGTTLVAAEKLGRRCYAMEVDPRYAQVTIERWRTLTGRDAERVDG
ncbi:DNA modification methylase [soil metagenome]